LDKLALIAQPLKIHPGNTRRGKVSSAGEALSLGNLQCSLFE
jgi:hypothetical protein